MTGVRFRARKYYTRYRWPVWFGFLLSFSWVSPSWVSYGMRKKQSTRLRGLEGGLKNDSNASSFIFTHKHMSKVVGTTCGQSLVEGHFCPLKHRS